MQCCCNIEGESGSAATRVFKSKAVGSEKDKKGETIHDQADTGNFNMIRGLQVGTTEIFYVLWTRWLEWVGTIWFDSG